MTSFTIDRLLSSLFALLVVVLTFSSTTYAQDPAAGAPAECVAAADSRLCGDFRGQMIDLRMARDVAGPFWNWNLTGVNSVGKLDAAILRMMVPGGDPGMFQLFGCPNWDGSGWRYRLTTLCGYLAQQSNKCPGNSPTGLVCPDAWREFKDSGINNFANATRCPQGRMSQVQTLFTVVEKVLPASTQETIAKCVTSSLEISNCGFGASEHDTQLAAAYCANAKNDPCCKILNLSVVDITNPSAVIPQAPAPSASATADPSAGASSANVDTSSKGLALPIIIGIAAGGALLLLLIVATIFCMRRRHARQQLEIWTNHTKLVQQQAKSTTPTSYSPAPGQFPSPSPAYKNQRMYSPPPRPPTYASGGTTSTPAQYNHQTYPKN